MTEVQNKFFKRLVDTLSPDYIKPEKIPFMIAPLYQLTVNNQLDLFYDDLEKYKDYGLYYSKDNTDDYTNGKIEINLQKYTTNKDETNAIPIFSVVGNEYLIDCSYGYSIEFLEENDYCGDCQCTPEDDDYRLDKHCCGHYCDWDIPIIEIKKHEKLARHKFSGDEHDFWDFEDTYYKQNKEAAAAQEKAKKEARRTYLIDNIEKMKAELASLS